MVKSKSKTLIGKGNRPTSSIICLICFAPVAVLLPNKSWPEIHDKTGDDARHRIPELEDLLAQYNYRKLVAFFLKRP